MRLGGVVGKHENKKSIHKQNGMQWCKEINIPSNIATQSLLQLMLDSYLAC